MGLTEIFGKSTEIVLRAGAHVFKGMRFRQLAGRVNHLRTMQGAIEAHGVRVIECASSLNSAEGLPALADLKNSA